MNQYRLALRVIALAGLPVGAVLYLIAVSSFDGNSSDDAGAAVFAAIGAVIFALGFFGLFFWLLAESIAHGQRALIQTLTRTTEPTVPTGPAAPDAAEV